MNQLMGSDLTTARTAVVLEDAALIHHTTWLARALSLSARAGLQLALVTPSSSKLTLGLATVLSQAGAVWVVAEPPAPQYDGLTGRTLTWDGEAYVPTGEPSELYLRQSAEPIGGVVVEAESLRPARRSTKVGQLTEAISGSLCGRSPHGWGVVEPVSEPWDLSALSKRYIKDSSPRNLLHAVTHSALAGNLVSTVRIERPRNGLVERVTSGVATPEPLDEQARRRWAEAMGTAGVRWAYLSHVLGFDPSVRAARYVGANVPSTAVFGAEALAAVGETAALEAARSLAGPRGHAELMGVAGRASLAVYYSQEPVPGAKNPVSAHSELTTFLVEGPRAAGA